MGNLTDRGAHAKPKIRDAARAAAEIRQLCCPGDSGGAEGTSVGRLLTSGAAGTLPPPAALIQRFAQPEAGGPHTVPALRSYRYMVINNRLLLVDPATGYVVADVSE
jgi:hypothetical protein